MYENVAKMSLDVYQNPNHYNFDIFVAHENQNKASLFLLRRRWTLHKLHDEIQMVSRQYV